MFVKQNFGILFALQLNCNWAMGTIIVENAVHTLKDLADGNTVSAEDIASLKEYLIAIFDIRGLRDKEFELKVKGNFRNQMSVDFVVDSKHTSYYVNIVFASRVNIVFLSRSYPFQFDHWIGDLINLVD